jgi:hypothetical protein
LCIATVVVSGCDRFAALYLVNKTGQTISVTYDHDGSTVLADRMPPDTSAALVEPFGKTIDCSSGDLVARTLAGVEIARRTEQICLGDTWFVSPPASSIPSPT